MTLCKTWFTPYWTSLDQLSEIWKSEDLTENLRKYVERTPLQPGEEGNDKYPDDRGSFNEGKLLMGNGQQRLKGCVYCGNKQHRRSNCTRVLTIANQHEHLKKNILCFNCTGAYHNAAKCHSRHCIKCGQKHHTSICEKGDATIPGADDKKMPEKNLSTAGSTGTTLHATIKGRINGQQVRIMIDTGASSSYICSDLITKVSDALDNCLKQ